MTPPFLTSPLLTVKHGFFTRQGGSSAGIYDSLNCGLGSNDNRDCVAANRKAVADIMGVPVTHLISANQVHSTDAIIVDTPVERPRGDAMVTNKPGIALGILTADCAPLLFADATAGVIGAAHAGWKGALGGVVGNTVAAMERLGSRRENIAAVIGPCIGPQSYEVGPEFRARFMEGIAAYEAFFTSGADDHFYFDLPGFIMADLKQLGVKAEDLAEDTFAGRDRFFSYRRSTHMGAPDYGRQISTIVLS
jgi:YfiH family protein